jgi:uncharacterized protein (TIGR00255 family)
MIRSMTGFAALARDDQRASIGVTIRSVNHRYLDVQVRMPQGLLALEARLRTLIQRRVSRGRVELTVAVQAKQAPAPEVELNEELVRRLAAVLDRARAEGLVEGALSPGDLLKLPTAVLIREATLDTASAAADLGAAVEDAVAAAAGELDAMRLGEGAHLKADLDGRRAALAALIQRIAAAADEGRAAASARLAARVAELAVGLQADQVAIAQEIVRTAARSDVSEETVRFRAHLAQWDALVGGDEPCGRKLDFLLQEMNREVNTIASKADGPEVSELIVEAKAELERAREQVQNVE